MTNSIERDPLSLPDLTNIVLSGEDLLNQFPAEARAHLAAMGAACRANRFIADRLQAEDFATLLGCAQVGKPWRWCIALVQRWRKARAELLTRKAAEGGGYVAPPAPPAQQDSYGPLKPAVDALFAPSPPRPPIDTSLTGAARQAALDALPLTPSPRPGPRPVQITRDEGFDAANGTTSNRSTLDTAEAKRVAEGEALWRKHGGFAPADDLFFAAGQATLGSSDNRMRQLYQDWADQQPTIDGLEGVVRRVAAEDRKTSTFAITSLEATVLPGPLGQPLLGICRLVGAERSRPVLLEAGAAKHLLAMIRAKLPVKDDATGLALVDASGAPITETTSILPGAFDMLSMLDPSHAAEVINRQLRDYRDVLEDVTMSVAHRRHADSGDQRFAYRVASERYAEYSAGDAARDMIGALRQIGSPQDARGVVLYNPTSLRFSAHAEFHQDKFHNLAVGDAHRMGIAVRNNDGKAGGVSVDLTMTRVRCINLTTLDYEARLGSLRHIGDSLRLGERVRATYRQGTTAAADFLRYWGVLQQTPVASSEVKLPGMKKPKRFDCVADFFEYGVKTGALDVSGSTKRDALAFGQGYAAEPGETWADAINALTRSVQMDSLLDDINADVALRRRYRAAELAGQLVPVLAGAA